MKRSTIALLVALSAARMASAQVADARPPDAPPLQASSPVSATALDPSAGGQAYRPVNPSLFKSIGGDFRSFFTTDTAKVLGVFAVAGLSVRSIDGASVEDTRERLPQRFAQFGNAGGSFAFQAGGSLATYVLGRATGNASVASLGGDMLRAQLLSQAFVQATKYAVGRPRPDGSDTRSFPSGHSASAVATATVVQQHFGWKAGIPAYALAGLVGASRLASSKHYLSDVLVGAGVGIAAGRTVTLRLGREKFALGAAPTAGGGMVTFTRN